MYIKPPYLEFLGVTYFRWGTVTLKKIIFFSLIKWAFKKDTENRKNFLIPIYLENFVSLKYKLMWGFDRPEPPLELARGVI